MRERAAWPRAGACVAFSLLVNDAQFGRRDGQRHGDDGQRGGPRCACLADPACVDSHALRTIPLPGWRLLRSARPPELTVVSPCAYSAIAVRRRRRRGRERNTADRAPGRGQDSAVPAGPCFAVEHMLRSFGLCGMCANLGAVVVTPCSCSSAACGRPSPL